MSRTYILTDAFDGRTLKHLLRVSSIPLARKHARAFAKTYSDDFSLIELRDGGERRHIQTYQGQFLGRPAFLKCG